MSKRRESRESSATPLVLNTVNTATSESDNQPKTSLRYSMIAERFRCIQSDINSHIFTITRYMNEHVTEIDATHTLLFIHLEKLKNSLLDRIEEYDPKFQVNALRNGRLYSGVEIDNYIISLILSVLDNPSSLEEDKMVLLYTMRACVNAIRSKNTHSLDNLKIEVARRELIEKEIALSFPLGTYPE